MRKSADLFGLGNDEEFEIWYKAYPVKKARRDAQKAWIQIRRERLPLPQMLEVLEHQKIHEIQWKRGYIPYPATYLRQGRFEDEVTEVQVPVIQQQPSHTDRARAALERFVSDRSHNGELVDTFAGVVW